MVERTKVVTKQGSVCVYVAGCGSDIKGGSRITDEE